MCMVAMMMVVFYGLDWSALVVDVAVMSYRILFISIQVRYIVSMDVCVW